MPSAGVLRCRKRFFKPSADGAVVAALGGARVYDDVPKRAEFPYLTFGQTTERDWSTATEPGHEHIRQVLN